jgi:hypothetical protein
MRERTNPRARRAWTVNVLADVLIVLAALGCSDATQQTRDTVIGTWSGAMPSTYPSTLTVTLEDGGAAQEGEPNLRRVQGTASAQRLTFTPVAYAVTGTFEPPILHLTLSHVNSDPLTLAGQVHGDSIEATLRVLDGEPSDGFTMTRAPASGGTGQQ